MARAGARNPGGRRPRSAVRIPLHLASSRVARILFLSWWLGLVWSLATEVRVALAEWRRSKWEQPEDHARWVVGPHGGRAGNSKRVRQAYPEYEAMAEAVRSAAKIVMTAYEPEAYGQRESD